MRRTVIAAAIAFAVPASAQQADLSPGLGGGVGSGFSAELGSGLSAGLEAGLGSDTRRTMADGYFRGDRGAGALGGGCSPRQVDPDRTGCRPIEHLIGEGANPNRPTTYYGNSAFGQQNMTYGGDSAFRSASSPDPNRPF